MCGPEQWCEHGGKENNSVTRTEPVHPACIKSLYSLSYFSSQCCVKIISVSVFIVNYTLLCKLLRMCTVKGRMTVNSVN
jgi:hypothetical protein